MSKISLTPNASGTGTLTIAAPNTSTDRTLTLPDETGTVLSSTSNITSQAMNGPAFSAKAASSQSISDSTWTKIDFGTELFDTNNCFSSSTFTPNVAGYYYISVIIRVGFSASWTNIGLSYRKNGSEILVPIFLQNINPLNTGSSNMFSGGGTLYFNGSSDYLEAYGYLTTGGAVREFNYASSSATSHLSGYLVRAA